MSVSPKFYALLDEIKDLHDRKNSNYAGDGGDPFANFRECEDFGIPAWKGVLTRMSDKWMRIKNLADGIEDKVGESMIDTLTDLAVYSLICRILVEEAQENEKMEELIDLVFSYGPFSYGIDNPGQGFKSFSPAEIV